MPEMVVGAVLMEGPMSYEKVVAVVNPDGSPINVDGAVSSVAGKTGAVTLAAGDITSGTFAIARIPTGTSGTTVALGNHTHAGLMTGSATNVPDSTATDTAGLVADFNALLDALAARGIITNT